VGSLKEDRTVVVVSYSGKEINAKLVYYGAGLSGKTTNLEAIHAAVPDTGRGKMVSMKTQSDRTLFFDLLPLDLGEVMGFKTRFLLYTVPGQVFYNATRKLVLKGADAIVFVADSEKGKMDENLESLANLRTNLSEYGVRLDEIPWALQYNKRDLPNVYTVDELNAALNPTGTVPFFEAVASQGKGVFETFRGVSNLLMEKVTRDLKRTAFSPASRPKQEAAAETPVAPPAPVTPAVAQRPVFEPPQAAPARPRPAVLPVDLGNEVALPGFAEAPAGFEAEPVHLQKPEARKAPAPVARPAPVAAEMAMARPKPQAPAARPAAAAAPVQELGLERPGLRQVSVEVSSEASATEAVIPITVPRGTTREIILRIVISDE
jgi:mutual gliding-motility protein MglA